MKQILYIYYVPYIAQSSGVFNKLIYQLNSAGEMENFKFLLLTCDDVDLKYKYLDIKKVSNNKVERLKEVAYILELYAKKYEIFIFRKFVFNPFILNSFRKIKRYYNTKIITEHHTKEIPEYVSKKEYKKIFFESMGILWMKYFKLVDGIVGVTHEITEYEKNIYDLDKGFTIGNGINIDKTLFSGFKKYKKNEELKLIISIGDYYPWHGIERLIQSIETYKHLNIRLNILLGSNSEYIINLANSKNYIDLYINLDKEDMKKVYKKSHLAISSLAVYKKKLNEATPLKSREYIQRGIPFIYGYEDTDLTNSSIDKYLFRVSNDNTVIDFDSIIRYLHSLPENVSEKLYEFGINNLSWVNKIKLLRDFVNEC